jgi:hypothetical protein
MSDVMKLTACVLASLFKSRARLEAKIVDDLATNHRLAKIQKRLSACLSRDRAADAAAPKAVAADTGSPPPITPAT